jgi:hypothetical protein
MHPPEIQEIGKVHPIGGAEPSGGSSGEVRSTHIEASPPSPPGKHPCDPVKKDLDPVGFALSRAQTFLVWIDEHRAAFEKARDTDPEAAESELSNLRDATEQGLLYMQRLSELILGGYAIDPSKRLPDSLRRGWFASYVGRQAGQGSGPEAEATVRESGRLPEPSSSA